MGRSLPCKKGPLFFWEEDVMGRRKNGFVLGSPCVPGKKEALSMRLSEEVFFKNPFPIAGGLPG